MERKRQPSRQRAGGRERARSLHAGRPPGCSARGRRVFEAETALGVGGAVTVMEGEGARPGLGPRGPPNFGTSGLEGGVR